MPIFKVNWFEIGSKLSLYNRGHEWYFLKTSFCKANLVADESKGNWKSFIVACFGLGIAIAVGLYLYQNVSRSKDGREENRESSITSQVMVTE